MPDRKQEPMQQEKKIVEQEVKPTAPTVEKHFASQDNEYAGPNGTKKDFQIYSLTVENQKLREENAEQKSQIFELRSDLAYLQKSIEDHLPLISDLEVQNRQLHEQLTTFR